jgi:methylmalonic aciduria homocystinuria type C protein
MEDLGACTAALAEAGIDIVTPLSTSWYNAYFKEEKLPLKPLPCFGRKTGAVALLVGNSKALWPAFLKWLASQPDPNAVADPIDTFVTASIEDALASFNVRRDVFWPWESGDRLVSMQRVAVCSALCYHDGETQLAIHPKFGAWVAFRALVVLDLSPSTLKVPTTAPERLGCLLSDDEKVAARAAMEAALLASDQANLCTQLHGANGMQVDVRLAWAALRDCVQVGKGYRKSPFARTQFASPA